MHSRNFFKIGVLKNSQENTSVEASLQSACGALFFQKETPAQVLSCEICKTFENIIFYTPSGACFCIYGTYF